MAKHNKLLGCAFLFLLSIGLCSTTRALLTYGAGHGAEGYGAMAYRGAPLGPPPMAAAASSSASIVPQVKLDRESELRDWRFKLREEGECILVVMADRDKKSRCTWRTVIEEIFSLRIFFLRSLAEKNFMGEASISPICGGAVAFCVPAGGADAAPAAAAESKKEEKVEEIEESDEDNMIFSLFG
uniref:Uncharacterized protein n=1 Tax=Cannabis sativa TaxID=3483 RepID=A0A803PNH5_CANSA